MIKRIFWVALFTGLSHLISLLTISYIIRELGGEISGYLGVIDSTLMLATTIISFGVQLAVNRNAATKSSWRSNYKLAQSARLMLSIILSIGGISAYFVFGNESILIYVFAPLIALNGDYALYGNGKPITAASLSFLRVALPNLGILAVGYFIGKDVIPTYLLLLSIGILLTGVVAAWRNGVSYFFLPRKNFLKFYFKYSQVGLYQVAGVLMVSSILVVANWFYTIAIIGLINGLLKILIVYKGGLRIIVQTFFKEIGTTKYTFQKIDKASILAWGAVSIPIVFFYNTTLEFMFNDEYVDIQLLLPFFGIIMLISSFRNSAEAKLLIDKKDKLNLIVFSLALFFEIATIVIFSFTEYTIWGIPMGFLVGEIILLIGLGLGLREHDFFTKRALFLLKLSPALLLVLGIRVLTGDIAMALFGSLLLYVVWVLLFYRKLIFNSLSDESP